MPYHIHDTSLKLRLYAMSITVHWVPGHTDIPGNESVDTLAKLATTIQPTWQLPISVTWLRRKVCEQYTADWIDWHTTSLQPKTYSTPHRRRLDSTYTTLRRKLSTAVLGLRTGHGYFLHCLAQPPSDSYPSRNYHCPLHPPQILRHLLLSWTEYRSSRATLRQDLKLHRNARLNMDIILHTTSGIKALSTFLSATKIAKEESGTHHTATATPPLHLQQPAPKPSIIPSDPDSQRSCTYLWKSSESSTLISLISVAKSDVSRDFAYPTTRNAAQT
jgi:hypothetical protein